MDPRLPTAPTPDAPDKQKLFAISQEIGEHILQNPDAILEGLQKTYAALDKLGKEVSPYEATIIARKAVARGISNMLDVAAVSLLVKNFHPKRITTSVELTTIIESATGLKAKDLAPTESPKTAATKDQQAATKGQLQAQLPSAVLDALDEEDEEGEASKFIARHAGHED